MPALIAELLCIAARNLIFVRINPRSGSEMFAIAVVAGAAGHDVHDPIDVPPWPRRNS
jgi:hypothetical protein